jgi:hypothetical protein
MKMRLTEAKSAESINSPDLLEVLKGTPLKIYFFTVLAVLMTVTIILACFEFVKFNEMLSFPSNMSMINGKIYIKFQVNDQEADFIRRHHTAVVKFNPSKQIAIEYHMVSQGKYFDNINDFQKPVVIRSDKSRRNIIVVSTILPNMHLPPFDTVIEFEIGKSSLKDRIFHSKFSNGNLTRR